MLQTLTGYGTPLPHIVRPLFLSHFIVQRDDSFTIHDDDIQIFMSRRQRLVLISNQLLRMGVDDPYGDDDDDDDDDDETERHASEHVI